MKSYSYIYWLSTSESVNDIIYIWRTNNYYQRCYEHWTLADNANMEKTEKIFNHVVNDNGTLYLILLDKIEQTNYKGLVSAAHLLESKYIHYLSKKLDLLNINFWRLYNKNSNMEKGFNTFICSIFRKHNYKFQNWIIVDTVEIAEIYYLIYVIFRVFQLWKYKNINPNLTIITERELLNLMEFAQEARITKRLRNLFNHINNLLIYSNWEWCNLFKIEIFKNMWNNWKIEYHISNLLNFQADIYISNAINEFKLMKQRSWALFLEIHKPFWNEHSFSLEMIKEKFSINNNKTFKDALRKLKEKKLIFDYHIEKEKTLKIWFFNKIKKDKVKIWNLIPLN